MIDGGQRIAIAIGALVAVVLQIVVAPNIMVFGALPNFVLAYCMVVAVVCARTCGLVMPFLLGLVYDLVGGGPIGSMSLLLVLMTFAVSRAFAALDNDTLFMPVALIVCSVLVVEIVNGIVMINSGVSASFIDALLYRSLPCALYDCVFALVMYPLAVRFVARPSAQPPSPLVG